MKRIEQYLQKLANNVVQSKTTVSQYYNIGTFIIRYSDHVVFPAKVDLQIIFPTASFCDYYAVFYRETTKPMILNAKQIANILGVLTTISQLENVIRPAETTINKELTLPTTLIQFPDKYKDLETKGIVSWNLVGSLHKLQGILTYMFNTSKGISLLRNFLLTHPCTYKEAVTVYAALRINNNIDYPTKEMYQKMLDHVKTLNK